MTLDGATLVFMVIGVAGATVLLLGMLSSGLLSLFGFTGVGGAPAESIAAFVGTFGFTAAIGNELLGSRTPRAVVTACAIGVAAAIPVAYLAIRLSRWARELPTDATPAAEVLAGDARRQATIAAAQADAELARLIGDGERARRSALAEAIEREGAADGAAILARGRADAEAMRLKADAFARYGEAATLDLLARALPQVVEAASRPISAIDKMTVISTDGASTLTRSVASNVAQSLQLGSDLTGVDLAGLFARLGHGNEHKDGPSSDVEGSG